MVDLDGLRSGARLRDKRAIITGASSGIGRAIALLFGAEGASIAACGRDPDRTNATCDEITEAGGRADAIVFDISQAEEIEAAVIRAVKQLGGLQIVVNCAGISEVDGFADVHEQSLEAWNLTLAVNVTAAFVMSKAAIPYLLKSGGGSLVHISSIASQTVLEGNAPYGVSKAALNQLSRHIAVEYAGRGIRSNAILPGEIDTPASTRAIALAEATGEYTREQLLRRYPAGRFGQPEEIAHAALFLCSAESGFLTGQAIAVDGAYTCV
jgi:NAD(P)-dependent dehydrogenase (short-subunit alcohol dehydrogenase family)